jgi:hypothetical protein
MTYKGVAKGRLIELEEALPYTEGQPVNVTITPIDQHPQARLAIAIQNVMHEPPHLQWTVVDEMEQAIAQGRLPVRHESVFDDWSE